MEVDRRRVLLKEAQGLLDAIVSLFGECCENIGFSSGVLEELSELFAKEDALLAGLQKSDASRYGNIR